MTSNEDDRVSRTAPLQRPDAPDASPVGREPRERVRWRAAMNDIAAGLERHLRSQAVTGSRSEWVAWAVRLAAQIASDPAPDGTQWGVRTHIELL